MKKVLVILCIAFAFVACNQQEQRYFGESAETKTLESGIAAYESGDWITWRSHFADTAKIYVNSVSPVNLDERAGQLAEMSSAFSSYGFDKEDDHIEMVIDKLDETWVYYWGKHESTIAANGKSLTIPVHLAVRFVDGKIVAEHIYFDGTELNAEMSALAAAAEEEAVSEESTE